MRDQLKILSSVSRNAKIHDISKYNRELKKYDIYLGINVKYHTVRDLGHATRNTSEKSRRPMDGIPVFGGEIYCFVGGNRAKAVATATT